MKYSVVIIDDQNLLSAALKVMVNTLTNFEVLYTCRSNQFKQNFKRSKDNIPDIVIADIDCPDSRCIKAIEWIRENHSEVKVMALFNRYEEEDVLGKIIKAGADGYIHTNTKKEVFKEALLALVGAGYYKPKKVVAKDATIKEVIFKDNELKFIRLACSELTYKEIADKMFLSPKTIDGYRDSLFTKLNVKNRVGMVMYALKHEIYVQ